MSESSDDEPIALKRRKVEHTNGSDKPARKTQAVSYKEDSESDDEPLVKKLPSAKAPASKPKKTSATKVKKEIIVKKEPTVKKELGAKKSGTAKKVAVKKEGKDVVITVKREKKVYDNLGQTRDTPDETDPLRKFYSSLLEQRPESMMAKKWLCMHGLLLPEEAEAYMAELGKVKSPEKRRAPASASRKANVKRPRKSTDAGASTAKRKIKKEVSSDEDSEDEFIVKRKPAGAKAVPRKSVTVKKEANAVKKILPKPSNKPRDVAFDDGGLGGSSDEDVPLAVRKPV